MNNFILVNNIKWDYIPDEEGMLIENDPEPEYYYNDHTFNLCVHYNDWDKKWYGIVNYKNVNDDGCNTPEEAAEDCLNYIHTMRIRFTEILNIHNVEVN